MGRGAGSYKSIFLFSLFMVFVWLSSTAFTRLGLNDQVPMILTGVALGPYSARLLPDTYAICRAKESMADDNLQHIANVNAKWGAKCADADYLSANKLSSTEACINHKKRKDRVEDCLSYPDVFTIIGHIGVSILIFRSGMCMHIPALIHVGSEAMILGILGTGLPIAVGFLATKYWLDDGNEPPLAPWAVGVSLSPTSIAMALQLLMDAKVMNTYFGQVIILGSLVDDIFALGAFDLLILTAEEDMYTSELSVKPNKVAIASVGFIFLVVGGVTARPFARKVVEPISRRLEKKFYVSPWIKDDFGNEIPTAFPVRDQFLVALQFFLLISMSYVASMAGSHLWGCFTAGMMFSEVDNALGVWRYQVKKIEVWFMRFFFAGSVGFSLNVDALLDQNAVMKGAVLGVTGAIGTKLLAASWVGDSRWVHGWAMTCRAEFAFVVAQIAYWKNILSDKMLSIVMWALFLATLSGPIMFQQSLSRLHKAGSHELNDISKHGKSDDAIDDVSKSSGDDESFLAMSAMMTPIPGKLPPDYARRAMVQLRRSENNSPRKNGNTVPTGGETPLPPLPGEVGEVIFDSESQAASVATGDDTSSAGVVAQPRDDCTTETGEIALEAGEMADRPKSWSWFWTSRLEKIRNMQQDKDFVPFPALGLHVPKQPRLTMVQY